MRAAVLLFVFARMLGLTAPFAEAAPNNLGVYVRVAFQAADCVSISESAEDEVEPTGVRNPLACIGRIWIRLSGSSIGEAGVLVIRGSSVSA